MISCVYICWMDLSVWNYSLMRSYHHHLFAFIRLDEFVCVCNVAFSLGRLIFWFSHSHFDICVRPLTHSLSLSYSLVVPRTAKAATAFYAYCVSRIFSWINSVCSSNGSNLPVGCWNVIFIQAHRNLDTFCVLCCINKMCCFRLHLPCLIYTTRKWIYALFCEGCGSAWSEYSMLCTAVCHAMPCRSIHIICIQFTWFASNSIRLAIYFLVYFWNFLASQQPFDNQLNKEEKTKKKQRQRERERE